ncbi:MAG: hypothetical protein L0332_11760 [Chloroflexi bacterium]|nr:hypothetical protein [Chloroflexota bacterium]MCI0580189.1 hypothetical protein [Chloroflexota bacterium]MCI0646043.1 hypothetical protein [Chloroflexota bacterium]MCI0727385.1 hypothetical protein [Chloroflexota bacterium]
MTIAEIHNKTPFVYSEDLLTADVFGAFRYLPTDVGILGFLRTIPELRERLLVPQWQARCDYYFWPQGQHREPDVLLELQVDQQLFHVVVEAKYLSGPSDSALVEVVVGNEVVRLGNQLADQLRDLEYGKYTLFRGTGRNRQLTLTSPIENRFLLYLTAHVTRPEEDLARSMSHHAVGAGKLCWANWFQVYDYLADRKETLVQFPFNRIVDDICLLLDQKLLSTFRGFHPMPAVEVGAGDGTFWKGQHIEPFAFHGITRPPALPLLEESSYFWRGGTSKVVGFDGIQPPTFDIGQVSGAFWQMAG